MTPQVAHYAEWRISNWLMYHEKRLKNPATKASAEQSEQEAALLRSVIDTPETHYTPLQRRWHDWIAAACELYHTARRDADYLARANALRERRDMKQEREAA